MTGNFLWRKYLVYHMYKPVPVEEKLKKSENSVFFSGPNIKCSYFVHRLVTNWQVMKCLGDHRGERNVGIK